MAVLAQDELNYGFCEFFPLKIVVTVVPEPFHPVSQCDQDLPSQWLLPFKRCWFGAFIADRASFSNLLAIPSFLWRVRLQPFVTVRLVI